MDAPPIDSEIPNEYTKILNVTGHRIEIGGKEFPIAWMVRLICGSHKVGEAAGVTITKTSYIPSMLPQREYNTIFLVSILVCQMNPDRDDFYIPATKDNNGVYHSIAQNPFYNNEVNNNWFDK